MARLQGMAGGSVGTATISLETDVSGLSDELIKAMNRVVERVNTMLDRMETSFATTGVQAGDKLGGGVEDGARRAGDAINNIDTDGITSVGDAAAKAGQRLVDSIGGGAGGAAKAVQQAGAQAAEAFGGIAQAAGKAGEATGSRFSQGMGAIRQAAQRAAEAASNSLSGVGRAAANAAQAASNAFSGVGTRISNALSSAGQSASRAAQTVRTTLTSSFREAESSASRIPAAVGKIGGALALVAGPAAMFKGGFDRLMDIQRSEIIFQSIGLSAQQTKDQMARLSEQVTGTSVSLSDAAKYSAMFAQSGVEMGKPMDSAIKAFTNLSVIAEGSGVDVGRVMQQISANTRVSGEDLNQFASAGVNAAQYLADYFGVSNEQIRKDVSEGKVSFEDFVAAVNAGTGDLGKQMGETLPAKLSNMRTAVSNLGATLIEPFIPAITAAVEFGTALLKGVIGPIKEVVDWFKEGSLASQVLAGALGVLAFTSAVGVVVGFVKAGGVLRVLSGIATVAGNAVRILNLSFLATPVGWVVGAVAAIGAAFVLLWRNSESFRDFWAGVWDRVTDVVGRAVDYIRGLVSGVWESIGPVITGAVDGVKNLLDSVFDKARSVGDGLRGAFSMEGQPPIMGVLRTIGDVLEPLWGVIKEIGGALRSVGESLMSAGWSVITSVFEALKGVGEALWGVITSVGEAFGGLVDALTPVLMPVLKVLGGLVGGVLIGAIYAFVGALWVVAKVLQAVAKVIEWVTETIIAPLIDTFGGFASGLVEVIGGVFTWIMEKAAWFVESIVPTLTRWWESVKSAWSASIESISGLFSGLWEGLQAAWDSYGQPVADFIGDAFLLVFGLIVLGIRQLQAAWDALWPYLQAAWDAVGQPVVDWVVQAFDWLWSGLQTVFGWIRDGWDLLWGFIQTVSATIIQPIVDWVVRAFGWLRDGLTVVFDWIKSTWATVWGFVQSVYDTIIRPVVDWVIAGFDRLKKMVGAALDYVSNLIRSVGTTIRSLYDEYVAPMVSSVTDGFNRVVNKARELKDKIKNAVSDAGQWLWDTGKQVVQGLIGGIGSMVGGLVDKAKDLGRQAISAAKSVLGIASPSKVFHAIGEDVGRGFVDGIAVMGGDVEDAAAGLGQAAVRGVPASVPTPVVGVPTAAAAMPAPVISAVEQPAFEVDPAPVQDALTQIGAAATTTATGLWAPAMMSMGDQATIMGHTVATTTGAVINPAITQAGVNAATTATGLWAPAMAAMNTATAQTGAVTAQTAGAVINPALASVGNQAWNVHNRGVNPALSAMRQAVGYTANSFATGASLIATQWARVREATAQPVRFAINSVFNDGIVGMWNSVSELLGTTRMARYPVRFATGGYVTGPGGPTDDKIPALLSDGEYVLSAKAVDKIGVHNLNAINSGHVGAHPNSLRSSRQLEGMLNDATFKRIAARYAGGGIVEGTPAWRALLRGYKWAQSRSGRPYVWGGSAHGSGGTDCSGFMSGIADVILGGNGARQWATGNFPGTQQGSWARGLAAGFAVGIRNGGPGGGHTAGTIGGVPGIPAVNVESGGSPSRVKFGAGAVGATDRYFNQHWHLRVVEGGRFVPGSGSGVNIGDLIAGATQPFRDKISSAVNAYIAGQTGIWPREYPVRLKKVLTDATQKRIDKLMEEITSDPGGTGVARWAPMARRALARVGFEPNERNVRLMLAQIQSESGGNPEIAQQIVDINGTGENAGVGLLQIIPGTFAAYRDPALPNDRRNPYANMVAALRYYKARYGMDLGRMWGRGHGYAHGGVMGKGQGVFHKTAFAPERVLSPYQTKRFDDLVAWLESSPRPVVGPHGGVPQGSYGEMGRVRRVEVTQNIHTLDARRAGDQAAERLTKLLV